MERWEIDEADVISEVKGSGKDGTIVAKDLKGLVDLLKGEKEIRVSSGKKKHGIVEMV